MNGTIRTTASLKGRDISVLFSICGIGQKEGDRSGTVFIRASRIDETETTSMTWPEIDPTTGDVVRLELRPEGEGDQPAKVRKSSEADSNLLTGGDPAKELFEAVSKFDKSLLGLLEKSKNSEPPDEHRRLQLAVGAVLAEVGQQLLYPVFRRHRELLPDELPGELL